MKRRSTDISKLRRPLKKSKIGDGVCGSTFTYVRMVLLWCGVLTCDFMFELRFEYFWPLWMFSRSVYESFRYQGTAFSLLFVLLTVTSDMTCYVFVPVSWLCYTASVYVWVQYVWHAERGVCLPTVSLWVLFVYIETWLQMHSDRHAFLHTEFSRHFAAHCIGYQAVTLGFTVKSYVAHRLCVRRQRIVAAQNGELFHLLYQSLPPDVASVDALTAKRLAVEAGIETEVNGLNDSLTSSGSTASLTQVMSSPSDVSPTAKCRSTVEESSVRSRCRLHGDIEYIENRRSSVNEFDEGDDKEKNYKNCSQSQRGSKWNGNSSNGSSTKDKKSKAKDSAVSAAPASTPVSNTQTARDELVNKLEVDVKRLRADLNSSRQSEQELRSQLANLSTQERGVRSQLHQLQQDNDQLQNKLHNLVTARQQEKHNVTTLEKRLTEEKRSRTTAETQLQTERKKANEASQKASTENKTRVRELETEMRQLRRENKQYSERIRSVECELQSVRDMRENQTDRDVLMSALAVMKERNQSLEKSLSSENQVKMNLYAALGTIKRELEISRNKVSMKEREVSDLNSKLADVLSVSVLGPSAAASPAHVTTANGFSQLDGMYLSNSSTADLFDHRRVPPNKMAAVAGETPIKTQLDPNAASYTPKLA